MSNTTATLDLLRERNLIAQLTNEEGLAKAFASGSTSVYCGFDPTASSLHIGNLLPIMAMAHLQRAGHRPIMLVGGATGMIGDPSGKSAERQLQTQETVDQNVAAIRAQLERFVRFDGDNAALMVNNAEWTNAVTYIEWLRDVGKYFTVNTMMAKESVRARLEDRSQGITYTEFSYMLLQANDFVELYRRYGCTVQVGGSDQWGNITAGIDLVRKKAQAEAFGITFPLVTTASGEKFGKSAGNAVWLDAERTSPYQFYQYWIQVDDRDAGRFLRYFTFMSEAEVVALVAEHESAPHKRVAQRALAEAVTRTVHGDEALQRAIRASQLLLGEEIADLSDRELGEVFGDVPSTQMSRAALSGGLGLLDVFAETLCKSKGEARRLVKQGGAYVNNVRQEDAERVLTAADLASESAFVLRSGRKKYHVVRFV